MQLDVFGRSVDNEHTPPLAAKLRPKSLMDFFGQEKIRPQLEKLVAHPRHVIFWGPPGTGKPLSPIYFQDKSPENLSFLMP